MMTEHRDIVDRFTSERKRLNDKVDKYGSTGLKRLFSLDGQAYKPGALAGQDKELLGLVTSLVLRCDDCIAYHLIQLHECGFSTREVSEALSVAAMVGGTITVPHIRRALDFWETLLARKEAPTRQRLDYWSIGRRLQEIDQALAAGGTPARLLDEVCRLLRDRIQGYDWVGFYMALPESRELILGPFAGEPTEHVRIPYGRGICGQAAATESTFVIDDVSTQDNYLSCSISVRSEIVVPVFHRGRFVAELDLDSHKVSAFGALDRDLLEGVARRCGALAASISESEQKNQG